MDFFKGDGAWQMALEKAAREVEDGNADGEMALDAWRKSAEELKKAIERELKGGEKGADQKKSGPVKKWIGTQMAMFFKVLAKDELDEEIGQTVLEIVAKACSMPEAENEEGDGQPIEQPLNFALSGTGGVSFEWLEAPLRNTDAIVSNKSYFETLLQLLVQPRPWIRLPVIEVIVTCRNNRPKQTEKAIESTPAGMERLVDVLDDSEEVVRNQMLRLLQLLTEDNEQLQNFMAFREGFSKLFQIIQVEREYENDMVVQDCLTIMNNILHENHLTQKLFVQGGHLSKIPLVLALPRQRSKISDRDFTLSQAPQKGPASPKSAEDVIFECSPAKMSSLLDGLKVVSNLVSGICPKEIYSQPWFDPEEHFLLNALPSSVKSGSGGSGGDDPNLQEELARRKTRHIQDMQNLVGSNEEVLASVAEIALCLPVDKDSMDRSVRYDSMDSGDTLEIDLTWSDLRCKALALLSDIVCLNEAAAAQVSRMQVVAPRNSILAGITASVLTLNDLGVHRKKDVSKRLGSYSQPVSVRSTVVCGILQIAIFSLVAEEKAMASYFWECLLHQNPTTQISIVGHAITPPPDDLSDMEFTSVVSPPAGRLLVDVFMSASLHALHVAIEDAIALTGQNASNPDAQSYLTQEYIPPFAKRLFDMKIIQDTHLRSARLLESLLSNNVDCKEIAMRIPVRVARTGQDISEKITHVDKIPRVDTLQLSTTKSDRTLVELPPPEEVPLFSSFLTTLAKTLRANYCFMSLSKLKGISVTMLRILFLFVSDSPAVAENLLTSVSQIVLFEVASRNVQSLSSNIQNVFPELSKLQCSDASSVEDVDLEGMACLCIGACIVALKSLKKGKSHASRKKVIKVGPMEVVNLISSRIGFEIFSERIDKLERIPAMREAAVSKRAKQLRSPLRRARSSSFGLDDLEVLPVYDRRFLQAYLTAREDIEENIITLYTMSGLSTEDGGINPEMDIPEEYELLKEKCMMQIAIVEGYKEMIRSQDAQIRKLKRSVRVDGDETQNGNSQQPSMDEEELDNLKRQITNLEQEKFDLGNENKNIRNQLGQQHVENQQCHAQISELSARVNYLESLQYNGAQYQSNYSQQYPPLQEHQYEEQFQSQYFNQYQDQYSAPQPQIQGDSSGQLGEVHYHQNYSQNELEANDQSATSSNQQFLHTAQNTYVSPISDYGMQEPPPHPNVELADAGTGSDILVKLVNLLRENPRVEVLHAFSIFADIVDRGCLHESILIEVSDTANALGELDLGLSILELSVNPSEDVKKLISVQKVRMANKGKEETTNYTEEDESSWKAQFESLSDEYAQVLMLLANQELDKQLLFDAIRKLGGDAAEQEVRARTYLQLARTLK